MPVLRPPHAPGCIRVAGRIFDFFEGFLHERFEIVPWIGDFSVRKSHRCENEEDFCSSVEGSCLSADWFCESTKKLC